jgi:hypothetical protein
MFRAGDEGSIFVRKAGIYQRGYTASQPRTTDRCRRSSASTVTSHDHISTPGAPSYYVAGNNMTVRQGVPQHITERRGRVVGITASYPRDPRVQISVQTPAIPTEFLWFSSFPPGKFWDSTLNEATTASSHILFNSSLTFHPSIRRYIVRSVNQ